MSLLQLHLQISQAEKALLRTQNNNYSDKSKQDYQNNLVKLFEKIREGVSSNPPKNETELYEVKRYLDFIFKNLEFLDSSTLNLIPYEIVTCLKSALDEWLKEKTEYIIVTSLINNVTGFSFDPILISYYYTFYGIFEKKYNILFKQRLIQINIPKALSRDYFVSVVHYHELGHFVDIKNSISDSVANDISDQILNHTFNKGKYKLSDLHCYFPFLKDSGYSTEDKLYILKNQLAEYFCDLFASQYVGNSLSQYLIYVTENDNTDSVTHPSTINRQKVSDDFLNKEKNIIVNLINKGLKGILKKKLAIRFEEIDIDDFYNLIPVIIKNDMQLHGLICKGWRIWNEGSEQFSKVANISPPLNSLQLYSIINNLIEKSIRNYIITKTWEKNKNTAC